MATENMMRFERALNEDAALRAKYQECVEETKAEGKAQSDGELLAEVAKRLGYPITVEELEQAHAAAQKVDDSELDAVAGGQARWCVADHACFTALMHTPADEDSKEACWNNYLCVLINKERIDDFTRGKLSEMTDTQK